MKKIFKNKTTLSLLLACVITSQIGCSTNSNNNRPIQTIIYLDDENDKQENKKESTKKTDKADIYINFFDEYEVYYNCPEYFLTEDEVDNIYKELKKDIGCTFVNNDNIFTLYDKIMENSFSFLEKHPEYESCFVREYQFDNPELLEQKVLFKNMLDLVLDEHFKDSTNNIDEDVCRMQNLKIVYADKKENSDILAQYNQDENIIYLYRMNIENFASNFLKQKNVEIDDNQNVYKDFLWRCIYWCVSHEFEHVFQSRCNCCNNENLKGKTVFSYSKSKDDDYYISSLCESSAESIFINFSNENNYFCYDKNFKKINITNYDYTYITERNIESLFMLLSLFKQDVNIKDYYSAIGNNDIDSLLNFFDMNNDKDRYTFYKLLHIADGINFRSNLVDRYESIEGAIKTNEDILKFKSKIGNGYIVEIFKIVLQRLATYTRDNDDFTLEENLLLLNFIKDKIFNHSICYDSDGLIIIDQSFVKDISYLEETYISFLNEYYDISIPQIRNVEKDINYSKLALELASKGENIDYLSEDKKNTVFNLLNRFSLLQPIIYATGITIEYDYYIKEYDIHSSNNLTLIKSKNKNSISNTIYKNK